MEGCEYEEMWEGESCEGEIVGCVEAILCMYDRKVRDFNISAGLNNYINTLFDISLRNRSPVTVQTLVLPSKSTRS